MSELIQERRGARDISMGATHDVTRNYLHVAVGFFIVAGFLVCGFALHVPDEAKAALAVTVLLAGLMLGTASFRFSRTGGDAFDPLFLLTLVLTLYFVFHAMWFLVDPSRLSLNIRRPFIDEMARSQAYLLLAYAAMLVAFAVARPRDARMNSTSRKAISETPMSRLLLIFAVGMVFNFVAFKAGAYSKSINSGLTVSGNFRVLRTIGFFSFVAYVGALLRVTTAPHESTRKARVVVYGVMLPGQIVWAFVTGTKSEAFFAVFALLLVRNYRVRLISARRVLASVIAFVVLFTPLVQTTRSETTAGNLSSSSDIHRAVDRFPNEIGRVVRGKGLLDGVQILQERTNGSESFALATKYTPTLRGYQFGHSWAGVPLTFVPRFLWHTKPNYALTRDFSEIYAGQSVAGGNGLALAPTFPGDLYMNFGLVGVLGGFLIVGFLLRALTPHPRMDRISHERMVFWYAVISVSIVVLEQDVVSVTSTTLLHGVVALTFLAACTRRTERSQPSPNERGSSMLGLAER
jgi:hypothetical protein